MNNRWREFLLAAGIVVAVFVAYSPAMKAGFVWDDDHSITNNSLVKANDGLRRIWLSPADYDDFPVTKSSFWLQWRLWGADPTGYHVTGIAFHAIVAVLVWLVLRGLNVPGAWPAALLFAVHPVNVPSVAWISEQKNTLSLAFAMLALLSYLRFEMSRRRRWYVVSLALFLVALGSKTSVVMLPAVLLVLAWWRRGRITVSDVVRSGPFFLASAATGAATIWFQFDRAIGNTVVRPEGLPSRIATAGWAPWFYLSKTLVPRNLMMVYPRWTLDRPSLVSFLPGLVLVACLLLLWAYRRSWGRAALCGSMYCLLMLLPVLGIVDMYYARFSLVSDHWQYAAMAGLIAPLAGGAVVFLRRRAAFTRRAGIAGFLALVALMMALTWRRSSLFRTQEALWQDNVDRNPACWVGMGNLAVELAKRGQRDEAIRLLSGAIELRPDFVKGVNNLGFILVTGGRPEEGMKYFLQAVTIDPDYAEPHKNIADQLASRGRIEEAASHYAKAIELLPGYAEAHNNYGSMLARNGRTREALAHFARAVQVSPDYVEAHFNAGSALAEAGDLVNAVARFSEALKLRPDFPVGHAALADALVRAGDVGTAMEHYRRALELRPDWPEVRQKMAAAGRAR